VKGTIKSTNEISALFKTAQRITTTNIIVLIAKANERCGSQGRVAFIAGKRLGSAPQRNKAKRLMRHAAFFVGVPWPGLDVAFIAREQTLSASLDEVANDIRKAQLKLLGRKKVTSQ
jgi:ribonuclease P protein component